MHSRLAAVILAILLMLASCSTDPLVARVEDNPMATPTLSFAEASSSETSQSTEGNGDPNLTFTRTLAQTSFFPIEAGLVDRGRDELLEQARNAGFEMMQGENGVTDESGNRDEFWTGMGAGGFTLFLTVTDDDLTVSLFLDG